MRFVTAVYNTLFCSIPICHKDLAYVSCSFYLKSKLNAVLNMISVKSKRNDCNRISENSIHKATTYVNPVRKVKHFPPATKEWINSIYVYNNDNTVKDLPVLDKTLISLIRAYFNLYSNNLRKRLKKHGSKRFEIRKARRLINRIFVGKPELKHGTDNIQITLYVYNIEKKYFINKINKIFAVYKLSGQNRSKLSESNKTKTLYIKKTNDAGTKIKHKLNDHKKAFFILKTYKTEPNDIMHTNIYNKYFIRNYINKFLRKEVISVFYKQMLVFNRSKFEKRYVSFLANNIAANYNKKIEFNFVNLKHVYLDSKIFSNTLVTKLKKLARLKKSFLIGVTNFLYMFKVPRVSSLSVYNEIFNRQYLNQNINNNILYNSGYAHDKLNYVKHDVMDDIFDITNFITKLDVNKYKNLDTIHQISTLIRAFDNTKYKIINGVRLEIAGRFTKRTSAARSVYKIRNKGSIRNKDSSTKGLPAVLLKGYAKSNLQLNKVYSKVRGGSFGIKSYLSGG